jgi:hypothetical protein
MINRIEKLLDKGIFFMLMKMKTISNKRDTHETGIR